MTKAPLDKTADGDNGDDFLTRWSRRKQAVQSGVVVAEDVAEHDHHSEPSIEAIGEYDAPNMTPVCDGVPGDNGKPEPPVEHELANSDFEALDFGSDYQPFMDRDVPDDVRNKALRKLWVSDPILANMDGLDDYCEDYTDAAMVPVGVVKTAYRIGRGFLSDTEVAEWEALGKPPVEPDSEAEPVEPNSEAEPVDVVADDAEANTADSEQTLEITDVDTDPWADELSDTAGAGCGVALKYEEARLHEEDDDRDAADEALNS